MSLLFGEIMVFEVQKATIYWTASSHKASTRFTILFCSQNAYSLLLKMCHLSIAFLTFLWSTPKIRSTCMLLLTCFAMTMIWRLLTSQVLVKPHFRCFTTPWISFNFCRSSKHSDTHSQTHKTCQNLFNNYTLKGNWVPFQELKNEQGYNIS